MLLLVSGATATLAALRDTPAGKRHLGQLLTPGSGNEPGGMGLPWACDNGCFGGLDEPKFRRMCEKASVASKKPMWVVAPDVVAKSRETLELWPWWMLWLHSLGLQPCFVLQDGSEDYPELPDARAFFIGGSTAFKESKAVKELAWRVKERRAWLHMGRVNTKRRFRWAAELKCDSVDGSGFSAWPDIRIPKALRWLTHLRNEERHPNLFNGGDVWSPQ